MSRILLVDDSAVDRRLFGGILERQAGLTVAYASSGLDALERLRQRATDLVITDMQMPDMDGLSLVSAIRRDYPGVPVILMTAHGSEQLAAQALQKGAASYVPKGKFNELLLDTVRDVLELTQDDLDLRRLLTCAHSCEMDFHLDNTSALDLASVHLAQQLVAGMGHCDMNACVQLGVALEEAVLNAVYHGNLQLSADQLRASRGDLRTLPHVQERMDEPPYAGRRVYLRMRISPDQAQFIVRDDGPGFDVRRQTKVALSRNAEEPAGRGFILMWALMDKVTFNVSGNQVTLIKYLDQHQQDEEAAPPTRSDAVAAPPQADEYGQLVPLDGGPAIRLEKHRVVIGRDGVCDIVVNHSDVSRRHCLMFVYSGWWYITDLGSANGVQVNGVRVPKGRIAPHAVVSIGKNRYRVEYDLGKLGAVGITPPVDPF
jgi:CheY-like chemotaxis protein